MKRYVDPTTDVPALAHSEEIRSMSLSATDAIASLSFVLDSGPLFLAVSDVVQKLLIHPVEPWRSWEPSCSASLCCTRSV